MKYIYDYTLLGCAVYYVIGDQNDDGSTMARQLTVKANDSTKKRQRQIVAEIIHLPYSIRFKFEILEHNPLEYN